MRKPRMFADDVTLAVDERTVVQEARRVLDEVRAAYDEVKGHLDTIERILAPITSSATSTEFVDELAVIQARREWRQAQETFWEKQALLKRAERAFQEAVDTETRTVTDERVEARRALIGELFVKLDEAVTMAEDIQVYDDETRRLGGVPPRPPVGELLGDHYRQNFVEANRLALKQDGWL